MAFLNPLLLLGLAGISIPIIIHLLNRRRITHLPWAAMRFLRVAIEQNQRRLQLEDRLLLLLRCLLLALLALALARPALRAARAGNFFGTGQTTAVILLDTSASLQHTDGVQTRFAKAQTAAEQILDTLPAGSAAALLFVADDVRPVIPEPTYDLNLVRRTIRETTPTSRATDLLPGVERAGEILSRRVAPQREIYLVTDRPSAGWQHSAEILQLLADHQPAIRTHIVFVSDNDDENLAVTDLHLATGLAPLDQPLRFEAQVTNFGHRDATNIRVSLALDGEPPAEEAVIESIPAGSAKTVSLFGKLRTVGTHTITARIPPDHLPADDFQTIAVPALKDVRVLLVDGAPGQTPRDSAVFYLRNALVPVPAAEVSQYFINVTAITGSELDAARLDDYDVVILADVAQFNPALLEPYLIRGGGLIIFAGPNINAQFYNAELFQRRAILPAAFAPPADTATSLAGKDYDHPIVALWTDPAAGTLTSARFTRWFPLLPAAAGSNPPRVILKLADGTPVMVERAYGAGHVVVFGSTANTDWNDLPVRPAFVPLIQRTLGFVLPHQTAGVNVAVGQPFGHRTDASALGKDGLVELPNHQRATCRVELVNGAPVFPFADTDFSGAYTATIATDPPTTLKFAAQPQPSESNLVPLPAPLVEALGRVAHVVDWTPEHSLRAAMERERHGLELSLPLLLLALVVAVVETGLAQWFSRSK